jgi:hypothetical protein
MVELSITNVPSRGSLDAVALQLRGAGLGGVTEVYFGGDVAKFELVGGVDARSVAKRLSELGSLEVVSTTEGAKAEKSWDGGLGKALHSGPSRRRYPAVATSGGRSASSRVVVV